MVDEMDTLPSTLGSQSRGLAFSVKTEQNLPGASTNCVKPRPEPKKFPEIKILPTDCRIPVWPFVVVVKCAKNPA
jgi:hypothetical protein